MITNEVAFIAIAVSDKERARKFYQEMLELKPARTQMDGAWVEDRSWPGHDRRRLSSGLATVARRNHGRLRGPKYRRGVQQIERSRRDVRHRQN